jgi:hypothetical protein
MTRQVRPDSDRAAEIYFWRLAFELAPDPIGPARASWADQVARCRPARRQRATLPNELRVRRNCGVSNTDW